MDGGLSHIKSILPTVNITLLSLLEDALKKAPDTEFIFLQGNVRVSLKEYWRKADAYAKGLLALGLKRGDTLAVLSVPTSENVALFLTAASLGIGYAHPFTIHPIEDHILDILPQLRPSILIIGDGSNRETLAAVANLVNNGEQRLSFIIHIYHDDQLGKASGFSSLKDLIDAGKNITDEELREARRSVQPSDPLMYCFSSGSTGKYKIIRNSQRVFANDVYFRLLKQKDYKQGALIIPNPDQAEYVGYTGVTFGLSGARNIVIIPKLDPTIIEEQTKLIAEAINKEKVETFSITRGLISRILQQVKKGLYELPSLQTVFLAGQAYTRELRRELIEIMKVNPQTLYVSSDAGVALYSPQVVSEETLDHILDARMKVFPSAEVKIVDDDGQPVPLGQEGEIWYHRQGATPEHADPKVKAMNFSEDGFFKSGDIGVMHRDGTIQILGRKTEKLFFKVNQKKYYPGPIEEVLRKHPHIREADVISAQVSDLYGDEVTFCLCLDDDRESLNEQEVVDGIVIEMNEEVKPCRIFYMKDMLYTDNLRKVSKKKLQQYVQEKIAEDPEAGMTEWYKKLCFPQATNY